MKKKKKKKRGSEATPSSSKASPANSFNNPFAGLSLSDKAQAAAPSPKAKAQPPQKKKRTEEVAPPKKDPTDIDPLEASIFLNAMSHIKRVENNERHLPEQKALDLAAREDALALVELHGMMEGGNAWHIEEQDGVIKGRSPGVNDKLISQLGRGEFPPGRKLDLHGLTKSEAHLELRRLIASSRKDGIRCVLVVTGRGQNSPDGQSILKQALPDWVSQPPINAHALAFSTAPKHLGSTGAFLILLKRKA